MAKLLVRDGPRLIAINFRKYDGLGKLCRAYHFLDAAGRERVEEEVLVNGRGDVDCVTRICIDVSRMVRGNGWIIVEDEVRTKCLAIDHVQQQIRIEVF